MMDVDINPENSFQLRPHSLKLKPGDPVVVVGKYFYKSYNFMAASGYFRMRRCDAYDCRELLLATCRSSISGDGGPLIDLGGQVVGITFYEIGPYIAVLPINIVYKLWEHYKHYKECRHPSYGIEASNIYVADIKLLERLMKKFSISNGVLVEKVLSGSYAESAGLREDDVILKCDGKDVKGFLELWDLMWEKVGRTVELEVARVDLDALQTFTMVVGEAIPNELNKWPQP
ncbi:hypothetical protein RND81_04G244700 [Saponaria officinalis]|uniref:PDZ domain-containing protein n=1 Tax=Saponaria officinalis TaxID=3572 RepID=A0AAW1LP73_SAPOF